MASRRLGAQRPRPVDQITPAACRLSSPERSVLCHLVKQWFQWFLLFFCKSTLRQGRWGDRRLLDGEGGREMERERKRVPINLPLCSQEGKSDQWESRMRKADLIAPVQQHGYCPPPLPLRMWRWITKTLLGESGEGKVAETLLTNKHMPEGPTRSQY